MKDMKIFYVEKLFISGNMPKKVSSNIDNRNVLIKKEKGLAAFRFYERELVDDGFDRMIYGEKMNFSKWIVMDQYYYVYDKNQMSYTDYLIRHENNELDSTLEEYKVLKKVLYENR